MRHTIAATLWFSLLPFACAPKAPEEGDSASSTGGAATLEASTSEGDGSAGTTAATTTTTDDTTFGPPAPTVTGEPTDPEGARCPDQGLPTLTPWWSRKLAVAPSDELALVRSVGALDEGLLAIPGVVRTAKNESAPAVIWVDSDGTSVASTQGSLAAAELEVIGVRVAGDSVVLLGPGSAGEAFRPYASRFAAGGEEMTRAELKTKSLNWPVDFELRGASAVVIGQDRPSFHLWLAEVDVATGEPAWEVMLPAMDAPFQRAVAVGPGGEIVAGSGGWPGLDGPEYKVWRVGDGGALLWESNLFEPTNGGGALADLLITPDGQVVAITTLFWPAPKIVMKAMALADGAPTWTLDVAVEDEAGVPVLQHGLVEPGALLLPIGRGPDFWDKGAADPLTAALHRVSFTGALLDVTPLPLADINTGPAWLAATRGPCGDLVLFQAHAMESWLGSFTP